MASTLFPDQTLLELILLVLDYHFDEDQEDMLNEMLKVMGQAEDTGVSKVETLIGWCDGILDPIVDEIEAAERAASMH